MTPSIPPSSDLGSAFVEAIIAIIADPKEAKRRAAELAEHRAGTAANLDETRATLQQIQKERIEADAKIKQAATATAAFDAYETKRQKELDDQASELAVFVADHQSRVKAFQDSSAALVREYDERDKALTARSAEIEERDAQSKIDAALTAKLLAKAKTAKARLDDALAD